MSKRVVHGFSMQVRWDDGYVGSRPPCGNKLRVSAEQSWYVRDITCGACLAAIDALLESGVLHVCAGGRRHREGCLIRHHDPRYVLTYGLESALRALDAVRPFWDAADAAKKAKRSRRHPKPPKTMR